MLDSVGDVPVSSRKSGTRGPSKTFKSGGVPINALMNIEVRVAASRAQAQLKQMQAQVRELERELATANRSASSAFGGSALASLGKWGSQVQWAGRQLTYNFTMPIALAVGASTKFALANEAAMTRIKKVYGDGSRDANFYAKEIDALGRSFEAMSNKYGVARADVENIAADWAAAGSSGIALAKATKLTIETMILGEIDSATATKTLISIQAQYNMAVDSGKKGTIDLVKTIDILNQVENQTGASMSDLIDGFGRAAGVARDAGIDVRHLAAMIAALTPAAGSASQAGNAIKTIISRLLSPTKEAADVMQRMGINVHDAGWQTLSATQRLEKMAGSFEKLNGAQKMAVSSTVASRWQINKFSVLMQDMAGNLGYYQKSLEATINPLANQIQREKELQAVLNSSPQKFKQIQTVMQNVMADAITPMIPELIRIANAFASLMQSFSNLSPEVKKLIIGFALVIAAIGPLLRIVGSFGTLFHYLITWVLRAGQVLGFLAKALWTVAAAPFKLIWAGLSGIASAVLAIPGAVARAVVAMAEATGLMGIIGAPLAKARAAFIFSWKALPWVMGTAFSAGMTALSGAMNIALIPVLNGVAGFFSMFLVGGFMDSMKVLGGILMGGFRGIFGVAIGPVRAFVLTLPMLFEVALQGIGNLFSGAWATISQGMNFFFARSYQMILGFSGGVTKFAGIMFGGLTSIATSAGTMLGEGFGGIMKIWPTITGWFYGAYEALYAGLIKIQEAWKSLSTTLQAAWATAMEAIENAYNAISLALYEAWSATRLAIQTAFHEASLKLWEFFNTAMTRLMVVMETAWEVTLAAMRTAWAATVAFLTSPIKMLAAVRWMMTSMAVIFTGGGKQLMALAASVGRGVAAAFSGPWGWAILAIVLLFSAFHKQIGEIWNRITAGFGKNVGEWASIFAPVVRFFQEAVGVIERAFWRLPQGVRDALMTVVRLVQQAAQGVRNMFANMFSAFSGPKQGPPIQKHATGGFVSGPGTGTSDSILAAVSNGEYVVNAKSTKKHRGLIEAINNNKYATGGLVGKSGPAPKATVTANSAAADVASYQKIADAMNGIQWNKEAANVAKGFASALPLFQKLLADWQGLKRATDDASAAVARQQSVVDGWQAKLNQANIVLDSQQKKLDGLQKNLDGLTNAYDAHKAAMENFANAPIQGMQAMNDEIFANQMAQKKLQLQMLQWEKQHGSIDKVKNSMAALQGEIEKMQGNISDLRNAGAGSDITGPLDAQVKAMKDQYAAMGQQVNNSPIQQMQDQLDALAQKGQELDLQNSLQFDPLTRQVDQLVNGMKELPFDTIVAGITKEQGAMAALQPQIDAANAAVEKQKAVVDAATASRDAISTAYDTENAKLGVLKDNYDALKNSISSVEDAMRGLSTASSDSLQAAKAAKDKALSPGVQNFIDAGKAGQFPDVGGASKIGREGGIADQSAQIDALTKELQKGLTFDGMDMFAPLKDMWNKAWDWMEKNIYPVVGRIWNALKKSFSDAFGSGGIDFSGMTDKFKAVWDTLVGWWNGLVTGMKQLWLLFGDDIMMIVHAFGDFFSRIWNEIGPALGDLGKKLVTLWPILSDLAKLLGGALLLAFRVITGVLSQVLGPVLNAIIDVFLGLIKVIGGVVDAIVGILSGNLQQAGDGIIAIFSGLWDAIFGLFNGAVRTVWAIVQGFVDGVVGFFSWLYDVLVGHSIVPDLINAIVDWFKNAGVWVIDHVSALVNDVVTWFASLPGNVLTALSTLGGFLYDVASTAFKWFKDTMSAGWSTIWNWLVTLPQAVWNGVIAIKDKLINVASTAFSWFLSTQKQGWTNIWNWLVTLPQSVWNGVIAIKDKLIDVASTAFWWFLNTQKAGWTNIWNWLVGLPQSAWQAIIGIKDKLIDVGSKAMGGFFDKVKSMWDGPGGILQWFKNIPGNIASSLSGIGGTIMDSVKKGWNSAASWVNDHAIGPINAVADKLGLHLPNLPGFKDGGVIPGPVSAHDNTIVKVRSGEGVILPEAVKALGGKQGLEDFNRRAKSGQLAQSDFGIGGSLIDQAIEWAKQGVGNAINNITNPAADALERFVPNPKVLSKFVSGSLRQIGEKARTWGQNEDAKAAAAAGAGLAGLTPAQLAIINAAGTYFPVNGPITAGYGLYPSSHKWHNGIDFGVPVGTPVHAWRGGKVIKSGWDDTGYGNYVEILHANDTISRYGHNSQLLKKVGDIVQGNSVISDSGSTGNSTGPHLHFGIKKNGVATDPWPYLVGHAFDKGGYLMPGEGRVGNYTGKPEPVFTHEQWTTLSSLVATSSSMLKSVTDATSGGAMGLRGAAAVSFDARLRKLEASSPTVSANQSGSRTININGDLSFPNIKSGDDAETFIKHLEILAG